MKHSRDEHQMSAYDTPSNSLSRFLCISHSCTQVCSSILQVTICFSFFMLILLCNKCLLHVLLYLSQKKTATLKLSTGNTLWFLCATN